MSNNKISFPHDGVFKHAMSDLRVAKDFFQHYLPSALQQQIDLDSLLLRKDSFVDKELKTSLTDLLYAVNFKKDNTDGFIYLLIEHQSSPDQLMPFRLLKYICKIIDQHVKENQTTKLPIVYPLVLYNGNKTYDYSTDIFDLFEHHALAKQTLLSPFQLVDLSKISDEQIRHHKWSGLLEYAMKHVFARDFLPYFERLGELINNLNDANYIEDYVLAVLNYVINTAEIDDPEKFDEIVRAHLVEPVGEKAMTIAEMLENRGIHKGIHQGFKQGINEGMHQGFEQGVTQTVKQMVARMLEAGSTLKFIATITGLSSKQIRQIQQEIER